MFKQFNKILVLVGAAGMLAMPAFAAEPTADGEDYKVKVGGKIRAYFGQYDAGITGEDAYLTNYSEANLQIKVTRGPISALYEVESRNNKEGTTTNMRQVTYNAGGFSATIGTCKPKASYAFSWGAGTSSSATKATFYDGLTIKTEADGLCLGYKAAEALKVEFTQYNVDALNKDSANSNKTGLKDGSGMQFGALGKFGDLSYRLSSIGTITDDHMGGDTTSHSGNLVGLKYDMGIILVSVDSINKVIETGAGIDTDTGESTLAYKTTTKDQSLQLGYTMGNKHSLLLTVATQSIQADSAGALETVNTFTDGVYSIPMAKGADMRLVYGQKSEKEGEADPLVASFAGLGMFAKF